MTEPRRAKFHRETGETQVTVELTLDGTGKYQLDTGNGTLDHFLAQLARHGLLDLTVYAKGDLETGWHHTVEDVAIGLAGPSTRPLAMDGVSFVWPTHSSLSTKPWLGWPWTSAVEAMQSSRPG